jgi:hypothetical protein
MIGLASQQESHKPSGSLKQKLGCGDEGAK